MADAIRCEDAVQRLWRYLDGSLDHDDHDEVEQHLSFCLRCCGEMEFARELQGLLRTRAAARIPEDTRDRLEGLIEDLDVGVDITQPGDDPRDRADGHHDQEGRRE